MIMSLRGVRSGAGRGPGTLWVTTPARASPLDPEMKLIASELLGVDALWWAECGGVRENAFLSLL